MAFEIDDSTTRAEMLADLCNNRRDIISTQPDRKDRGAPLTLSQRDRRILENSRLASIPGTAEYELSQQFAEEKAAWKAFKADLDPDVDGLEDLGGGQLHRKPKRLRDDRFSNDNTHHHHRPAAATARTQHYQPQTPQTPSGGQHAHKKRAVSYSRSSPTRKTGGGIIAAQRIMMKNGWSEGQGLGRDGAGIVEAITLVRLPDRAGLGHVPKKKKRSRRPKKTVLSSISVTLGADLFSRITLPTSFGSQSNNVHNIQPRPAVFTPDVHPQRQHLIPPTPQAPPTAHRAMPPPPTTSTFAPQIPNATSRFPNADWAGILALRRTPGTPKELPPYLKTTTVPKNGGGNNGIARQPAQPVVNRPAPAPRPVAPVAPRHPQRAPVALADPKDWLKSRDEKSGIGASKWAPKAESAPASTIENGHERKDSVINVAELIPSKKTTQTVQTTTTSSEMVAFSEALLRPSTNKVSTQGQITAASSTNKVSAQSQITTASSLNKIPAQSQTTAPSSAAQEKKVVSSEPLLRPSPSMDPPRNVQPAVATSAVVKQKLERRPSQQPSYSAQQLISLAPDAVLTAGMEKLKINTDLFGLRFGGSSQGVAASKWAH